MLIWSPRQNAPFRNRPIWEDGNGLVLLFTKSIPFEFKNKHNQQNHSTKFPIKNDHNIKLCYITSKIGTQIYLNFNSNPNHSNTSFHIKASQLLSTPKFVRHLFTLVRERSPTLDQGRRVFVQSHDSAENFYHEL